jgi:hypothetical protein
MSATPPERTPRRALDGVGTARAAGPTKLGRITPSSVAPPNHQREANPSNDTLSKQKTT